MTSHESPGSLRRLWAALGSALTRCILGKSGHDSMRQFAASDEYWGRAIAAQLGCPQNQPPLPDPDRFRNSGHVAVPGGASARDTSRWPPGREFGERVHGWTKLQLDDYLARNPGYGPAYECELRKRSSTAAPEVNAGHVTWLGLWRSRHDKAPGNSDPNGAQQAGEPQTRPLCGL
jgi:hypothetical protein